MMSIEIINQCIMRTCELFTIKNRRLEWSRGDRDGEKKSRGRSTIIKLNDNYKFDTPWILIYAIEIWIMKYSVQIKINRSWEMKSWKAENPILTNIDKKRRRDKRLRKIRKMTSRNQIIFKFVRLRLHSWKRREDKEGSEWDKCGTTSDRGFADYRNR